MAVGFVDPILGLWSSSTLVFLQVIALALETAPDFQVVSIFLLYSSSRTLYYIHDESKMEVTLGKWEE